MGEAPAFAADNLQIGNGSSNGLSLKSQDSETTTVIRDKTYVICGSDESVGVKIYDKCSGNWVIPTVLGTQPKPCKGHSAVLLNEDRILVIKKGSSPNDCLWFLEADTPYVREQKKMVGGEVVGWSKVVIGDVEKPVVISGPSGVGKGTLISMLMKEFPTKFGFSVSHTTRVPRAMEKDGVHYHFIEPSVMEKEIKDGKFLEFASVHGNLYGTSIEAVEALADDGKSCILDIDVQGARSVRVGPLDAIFIFICPPSLEKLEERLRARGTETEEQILKRLRNAKEEIEQGKSSGIFDHILYNDNLEQCYDNLKKLLGLDGSIAANHQKYGFINQCSNSKQWTKVSKVQRFSMTWLGKLVALLAFPVLNILRLICRDKVFNPMIGAAPKGLDLPADHSVSKLENKIIINCGIAEGKASKNLIILDVSLLKGGAPGRTRGLQVYTVDKRASSLYSRFIFKWFKWGQR